ncbi:MAG: BMP family ABC transporter substrate-binding protein [Erysipelotrichaceae bacterium]|nr:BMP family ABC transporter substrate-binding protein [Erysipelotrichaceae bacterium]
MDTTILEEYRHALRDGQKEFRERTAQGKDPYPAVLDRILPDPSHCTQRDLPLQEIPVDKIVGMRSEGRTSAFSAGFHPLMNEDSEFAYKWKSLCEAHLSDTGIRDAVQCYEYLGNFYIEEGNKRVSVLKHFGAVRIPAVVKRLIPPCSEESRIKAYYEFLSFYERSRLYDIQFRRPGDYRKLLSFLGKKETDDWSEQERHSFVASYHYFREAFLSLDPHQDLSPEEALLLWLQVYPAAMLKEMNAKQLKKSLADLWKDVLAESRHETIDLKTVPENRDKNLLEKAILSLPRHLRIAFIHQQDADSSSWTLGHLQGVTKLADSFGEKITVRNYCHADSPEQCEALLEEAVKDGAEVLFTTAPQLLRPTLKVALRYPKLRFLNCSADNALSSVRSYYCRAYEGKFVLGALAGILCEDERIAYIGTYPIMSVPAAVNAFALGVSATNPKAKVVLDWACLPGDAAERLQKQGIRILSRRDLPTEDSEALYSGQYGLGRFCEDGHFQPLAAVCWQWGNVYCHIIDSLLSGDFDPGKAHAEAINYWWGFDSDSIGIRLADDLPEGVKTLAELLVRDLREGRLDIFKREFRDQQGLLMNDGKHLESLDLLRMDRLCENVEGKLPAYEELQPFARTLVRELGVHRELIGEDIQ